MQAVEILVWKVAENVDLNLPNFIFFKLIECMIMSGLYMYTFLNNKWKEIRRINSRPFFWSFRNQREKKRRQEKDLIKIHTCNLVEGEGTEMKRKEREFSLFVHRFFSYELENLNFKNKKSLRKNFPATSYTGQKSSTYRFVNREYILFDFHSCFSPWHGRRKLI